VKAKTGQNQTMDNGYVVHERMVPGTREPGDTAETKITIDASSGCERLEQRVIRFDGGRSQPRSSPDRHEVLYVVSGHGTLDLDGTPHRLEPEMGVYVAAGETYTVEPEADDELVLVSVTAPAEQGANGARRQVTVRYADQPTLPATPNREFRYLVNQDAGCPDVTQFIGVIPPGRAGFHSHTYDEVVYVVEGEGVLHLGGEETPLRQGTCIHLPPLAEHTIENAGESPMRVLGVFHPSGDPASRAVENPA
jgi:mannose-6-phosphate isomerase-like protein (cupin superfamily)